MIYEIFTQFRVIGYYDGLKAALSRAVSRTY